MTPAQQKIAALDRANLASARILLADPALEPGSLAAQWAAMVLKREERGSAPTVKILPLLSNY